MTIDIFGLIITLDFSSFTNAAAAGPIQLAWYIFVRGGFLVFVWLYGYILFEMVLWNRQWKFGNSIEYVMLAIDVPKGNEQTPKAFEYIFATFSGLHGGFSLMERWQGAVLPTISLELVSIEGFTQYIIRAPKKNRDLIEAAIYAQYPTATVTEVADYSQGYPLKYPNDEYDIFGLEIKLAKDSAYPIRTYPDFEHPLISNLNQSIIDPLANMLEVYSRVGSGEQIWMQIVLETADKEWIEDGVGVVKKLIGAPAPKAKKGAIEKGVDRVINEPLAGAANMLLSSIGMTPILAGEAKKEEKSAPSLMQYLSGGEKMVVEKVEEKLSKIAFKTKIRAVYVAKVDRFNPALFSKGWFGVMKQFNTFNLNGFKKDGDTITGVDYFKDYRVPARKKKLMYAYQQRSHSFGPKPFYLNVEELASIYHFPMITVKAPLISTSDVRRAEPPFALPVENAVVRPSALRQINGAAVEPPTGLPTKAEQQDEDSGDEAPPNLPMG